MENRLPVLPTVLSLIFAVFGSCIADGFGEERSQLYPFDVTLDGQLAKVVISPGIYATVAKPVPSNAEIVLGAEPEMIIANVFTVDKDGNIDKSQSSKAKIIMAQNANRVRLSDTVDKSVLKPGFYLMNIVLSSKGTSRVFFQIGDGKNEKQMPKGKPTGNAIDQSDPESVVTAIFNAARSGDYAALKPLLPPSGKCDGDVKEVCGVGNAGKEEQDSFRSYFEKGKVTGETEISPDGGKAAVSFLFGPSGKKKETMNLVKEGGKWYLGSF